jgi:hypothetical protein
VARSPGRSPKAGIGGSRCKSANERIDRRFDGRVNLALRGLGVEAQQVPQLNVGPHQRDEMLSGEPGVWHG